MDHWVSVREAAIRFSVSQQTVRQWIKDGLVPVMRLSPKSTRLNVARLKSRQGSGDAK